MTGTQLAERIYDELEHGRTETCDQIADIIETHLNQPCTGPDPGMVCRSRTPYDKWCTRCKCERLYIQLQ